MLLLLLCLIGLAAYLTWIEWNQPELEKKEAWQLESHRAQEQSLARLLGQGSSKESGK